MSVPLGGCRIDRTWRRKTKERLRRERRQALISEFLWATVGLPEEEVAGITGMGVSAIRRWRTVGIRTVDQQVLGRMRAYLAGAGREGAAPAEGHDEPRPAARIHAGR